MKETAGLKNKKKVQAAVINTENEQKAQDESAQPQVVQAPVIMRLQAAVQPIMAQQPLNIQAHPFVTVNAQAQGPYPPQPQQAPIVIYA